MIEDTTNVEVHAIDYYRKALELAKEQSRNNPESRILLEDYAWRLYAVWWETDDTEEKSRTRVELDALRSRIADEGLRISLRQMSTIHVAVHAIRLPRVFISTEADDIFDNFFDDGLPAVASVLCAEPTGDLESILTALESAVDDERYPVREVRYLVWYFISLSRIHRTPEQHFRIMYLVARATVANRYIRFCSFLYWWNPSIWFQREYPSVASLPDRHTFNEYVMKATRKTVPVETDTEALTAAAHVLEVGTSMWGDHREYACALATALVRTQRIDEALRILIPLAQRSPGAGVWRTLSECYPPSDERRLWCLSKALWIAGRMNIHTSLLRLEFSRALHSAGYYSEAKFEIQDLLQLRAQTGRCALYEFVALSDEEWFPCQTPRDSAYLIKRLSARAEELLYDEAPWRRGMIKSRDVHELGEHVAYVLINQSDGTLSEIRVNMSAFSLLHTLRGGAPVEVRLFSDAGRTSIIDLRNRKGTDWDLYPEAPAVVTEVMLKRKVSCVARGDGSKCLMHHVYVPGADALRPGDFVFVRYVRTSDAVHAKAYRKSKKAAEAPEWHKFTGLYLSGKRGGTVDDVYVPLDVLKVPPVASRVSGIAILGSAQDRERPWIAVVAKVV